MSDTQRPLKDYAASYDRLYRGKDYKAECDFIEAAISRFKRREVRSILDLGCGTGGHAVPLAQRGYEMCGVDLSAEMLAHAREKAARACVGGKTTWVESDITTLKLNKAFDAVTCMFAVLSYQISNDKLQRSFKTVREHLRPDGLFVCDFWYGPAVLRDPPIAREKMIEDGEIKTKRLATPCIDFNANMVEVCYDLTTFRGDEVISRVEESHPMRYLFLPEVEMFANLAGLSLMHFCDCCNLDSPANESTWTISAVFQG